ncbi:hypothetical protein Nepgr_029716 [Nepenthes gracilis]|uniref:Uncharacterized protein n=1 Tax=Nepenthes gracilis TaxID=150966 RepID=A0AAD3TCZ6_NEPGR|nr:hypothetical protein Nepgr_029716 [Nepenthes gracilis]
MGTNRDLKRPRWLSVQDELIRYVDLVCSQICGAIVLLLLQSCWIEFVPGGSTVGGVEFAKLMLVEANAFTWQIALAVMHIAAHAAVQSVAAVGKKQLGRRNLLQVPSALLCVKWLVDVVGASMMKHWISFCDAGFLAVPLAV